MGWSRYAERFCHVAMNRCAVHSTVSLSVLHTPVALFRSKVPTEPLCDGQGSSEAVLWRHLFAAVPSTPNCCSPAPCRHASTPIISIISNCKDLLTVPTHCARTQRAVLPARGAQGDFPGGAHRCAAGQQRGLGPGDCGGCVLVNLETRRCVEGVSWELVESGGMGFGAEERDCRGILVVEVAGHNSRSSHTF